MKLPLYRIGECFYRRGPFRFPWPDEDKVPPWDRKPRILPMVWPSPAGLRTYHDEECSRPDVANLFGALASILGKSGYVTIWQCPECEFHLGLDAPDLARLVLLNPMLELAICYRLTDARAKPWRPAEQQVTHYGDPLWLRCIGELDSALTGSPIDYAIEWARVHAPGSPTSVQAGLAWPLSDHSELCIAPGGNLMLISTSGARNPRWGTAPVAAIESRLKAMLGPAALDITAPRDNSPNLAAFFGGKRGSGRAR